MAEVRIPISLLIVDSIKSSRVLTPDDIIIHKWTGKQECVLRSSQVTKIIMSRTLSRISTGKNGKIPSHPVFGE